MGYYIRILGKTLTVPPLEDLQQAAIPAVLEPDEVGADGTWNTLLLKHSSGLPIAFIEKNPTSDGLGADELREFIDEVGHYEPKSAATWLKEYLPGVKVIYAFQLLSGADVNDGFSLTHRLYDLLWKHSGGILQADLEGFSNENGNTILWQFSGDASGEWDVAVLTPNGRWMEFEMDLGNQEHREKFLRGEVPVGVKLI